MVQALVKVDFVHVLMLLLAREMHHVRSKHADNIRERYGGKIDRMRQGGYAQAFEPRRDTLNRCIQCALRITVAYQLNHSRPFLHPGNCGGAGCSAQPKATSATLIGSTGA